MWKKSMIGIGAVPLRWSKELTICHVWHSTWEANHVEYRAAPSDFVQTSKFNSCKISNCHFLQDTTATNRRENNYEVLQNAKITAK